MRAFDSRESKREMVYTIKSANDVIKYCEYDDFKNFTCMDFSSLPQDTVLLLDTNMVGYIASGKDSPWFRWFQAHVTAGNQCFITPTVMEEFVRSNLPVPGDIVLLQVPHPHSHSTFTEAISVISDSLHLTARDRVKLGNDIKIILEASHLSVACEEIPLEVISEGRVGFMTANMSFLRRALGSAEKRDLVEQTVNHYGFDHLVKIFGVSDDLSVITII